MKPMRILILGGTVFVGRAATGAAISRGHEVTHFNRGRSAPPDPRVETLPGDRGDALVLRKALDARSWDAVIDTSGYLPQVVRLSAEALRERVARYLFVSSISVYASFDRNGFDEDAAVCPAPDPLADAMTSESYGPLKAACESVVRHAFGERATIVRPGLIVGPHDPTDRFTYWTARVARGGRVAAPGRPARRIQLIDARDLAEWMVRLLEANVAGTFNASGPREPLAMCELLETCQAVSGSDARFEWIGDQALLRHDIVPWKDMPLWIPEADGALRGFMAATLRRALAHGLQYRALAATVADTLAWSRTRVPDWAWKAGLTPDRERALLESAQTGSAPSSAPPRRAG